VTPFTTDIVAYRDRPDFWADLISRQLNPMRIEPIGESPFRGEVEARDVGGLAVAVVSGQGLRAVHGRREVALSKNHFHVACVHIGGEARIIHRGQETSLRSGDVFLTDSRHEFEFSLERPWKHLVLAIPTHWLDGRLTRPERVSGAVLRDQPLARLWARHLADGYALADSLSPAASGLFTQFSIDLLSQALEEHGHPRPKPTEAWRAALFQAACRSIALEFGDPALTPDRVASSLHVSARTLARIFAEHDETIMRHVYDERTRRAARLLVDDGAYHRSVTDIAFACGFNDASHFGRVFAARMHMTPSRWRQQRRDREG
jgi:AraC family transcriptional regulator, positive regulator of tynA and feaB